MKFIMPPETINSPTFSRGVKDKDLFPSAAAARFHFKLMGGALTEVCEPTDPG